MQVRESAGILNQEQKQATLSAKSLGNPLERIHISASKSVKVTTMPPCLFQGLLNNLFVTECKLSIVSSAKRPEKTHCHRLCFLPVSQQVSCTALHCSILLNYLHLQVCYLLLNGRIFATHYVIESTPLSFNVVTV